MILLQLERFQWRSPYIYHFVITHLDDYENAHDGDQVGDWFKYRYNPIKEL